jgi:hypothetical protein
VDLRYADLSSADLSSANLRSANLRSANLSSANLSSANTDKRYIQIACIGSRKGITTYCFEDNQILCGCFAGTLQEFENKVKAQYGKAKEKVEKQYSSEYMGFIKYLKFLIRENNNGTTKILKED